MPLLFLRKKTLLIKSASMKNVIFLRFFQVVGSCHLNILHQIVLQTIDQGIKFNLSQGSQKQTLTNASTFLK